MDNKYKKISLMCIAILLIVGGVFIYNVKSGQAQQIYQTNKIPKTQELSDKKYDSIKFKQNGVRTSYMIADENNIMSTYNFDIYDKGNKYEITVTTKNVDKIKDNKYVINKIKEIIKKKNLEKPYEIVLQKDMENI